MDAYKWLYGLVKKYLWLIGLALALLSIHIVMIFVNPYITGFIVDTVVQGGRYELLGNCIIIVFIGLFVKETTWYARSVILDYVSQTVILNLRCKLYKRLQELDFQFFDHNRTGDIMSRMTGDMDAIRMMVANTVPMMFQQLAIAFIGLGTMFFISPALMCILMTVMPFVAYFARKMSKSSKPAFIRIREMFSRLNSTVQENVSGNRVVKAYTRENYEIEKFEAANLAYEEAYNGFAAVYAKYIPTLHVFAGMIDVLFILFGGLFAIRGWITYGQFATINGILWCIIQPTQLLGGLLNQMQQFVASSLKIRMLETEEPKIQNHELLTGTQKFKGKVTFKNVVFSYDEERVLKYINFTALPGQTVAIIGPTGSGKSSLTNLISRFYDPDMGAVYIDDVNVKNIDVVTLRRNVSVAMQDVFLFSDTIEGNIAYGVPEASFDDVVRVAKAADAHEFILKMPEGYDTIVGERGVGLSGGQKQRIALARALLKEPSVLILDDTTSALDMETEFSIQETLKNAYSDKTTFIIAHRISSVKNADLILVLNKGKVIEWGTHDELVAMQGYYHDVYQTQFGDFNEAPPYKEDENSVFNTFHFRNGGVR